jgi:hypothetical protein
MGVSVSSQNVQEKSDVDPFAASDFACRKYMVPRPETDLSLKHERSLRCFLLSRGRSVCSLDDFEERDPIRGSK